MLSTALPLQDPSVQTRLQFRLDAPLPSEIAVGTGTALFVCGSCFHSESRVRTLSFVLDGAEQQVARHGMPRLDLFRSLHPTLDPFATAGLEVDEASPEDPQLHSYLSGFWGVVNVPPTTATTRELLLRARLENGQEETVCLGRLEVRELARGAARPAPHPDDGPLIAICMATYEPAMELFRRQVGSIRDQTYRNWICIISDDCSSPGRFAELEAEVSGDPRFVVSRSPRRRGF
jgi:hypothetical protein